VATDAPIAEARGQYLKLAVVAARLDCSVKTLKEKILGGELEPLQCRARLAEHVAADRVLRPIVRDWRLARLHAPSSVVGL